MYGIQLGRKSILGARNQYEGPPLNLAFHGYIVEGLRLRECRKAAQHEPGYDAFSLTGRTRYSAQDPIIVSSICAFVAIWPLCVMWPLRDAGPMWRASPHGRL